MPYVGRGVGSGGWEHTAFFGRQILYISYRKYLEDINAMGDFKNAAILINLFTRWHHQEVLEDIEIYRGILQNYINIQN